MSEKIGLSRQISDLDLVIKSAREALRRSSISRAQQERIIEGAEAALATLRTIAPVEDQVRELIIASRRSSH